MKLSHSSFDYFKATFTAKIGVVEKRIKQSKIADLSLHYVV